MNMRIPIVFNAEDADLQAAVARSMAAARTAQPAWSATPLARRLELIRELRHLIATHALQLAEGSASARGRPALESLTAEVLPLAEACRFLEREAKRILAPRRLGRTGLPLWLSGVRSEVSREPFGVILVIGPGNYPLLLPGVQIIQALAAGNAVLLKPGLGGMAVAQALCELITSAGFDPQLVKLLPESPAAAIAAIAARPDKVLFTGSAATGENILGQLAPQIIPAAMELSGCDAVILRADADLDLVVKALAFGLTLNDGATCMSPKRVFVPPTIATELEGRLARRFAASRVPTRASRASLTETERLSRLGPLLDEALARGAHFVAGGETGSGDSIFPIVLAGVHPSSRLMREDLFAPVLAILTVADDDEAISRANDCPFALGASIFSRDERAARRLAARLVAGMVAINDLIIPTADARLPFGGRNRSGFGVTRGAEGLLELTTVKVVTVCRGRFRPAFDAPQPRDELIFDAYLNFTHGRSFASRSRAFLALIGRLSRRPNSS